MPSLIDRLIMDAVRCRRCGARLDECNHGAEAREARERAKANFIERETKRLLKLSDADLIAECERLGVKVEG